MTSVDISSFLLINAADIPCFKLCWYWSIIRLFKWEITIETCRLLESMSKIKGGNRKHILFPNPVGKTPTQCFFWIKLFTTDTCSSFNSKSNRKTGLILSSNSFLTESAIFVKFGKYVTMHQSSFQGVSRNVNLKPYQYQILSTRDPWATLLTLRYIKV